MLVTVDLSILNPFGELGMVSCDFNVHFPDD